MKNCIDSNINITSTAFQESNIPKPELGNETNSYLPWYFQLTDLNPKIEEEK